MNKKLLFISVSILAILIIGVSSFVFLNSQVQTGVPTKTPFEKSNSEGESESGFTGGLFQSATQRDNIACSPSAGYNTCTGWEVTETSGGEATARAYVEIQSNEPVIGVKKGEYYVGDVYLPYKFVGDKFYYVEGLASWNGFWENVAKCSATGCSGNTLPQEGKLLLAKAGESYTTCPAFYVFDYDRKDGSDGSWASAWKASAWGYTGADCNLNIKSVVCYEDVDCIGTNEYCDKSGTWQTWDCKQKTTFFRYSNESNICTPVTIAPSQKQISDYDSVSLCNEQVAHPEYLWYTLAGLLSISIIGIVFFWYKRSS
ncbi:hypothetical protein M0R04_09780 [Candidatus Dojkabacteria bacterium]|jgi:hypothetical protein|nr:hypothetical protein [Candidatus Dojkabacteria bacterium]